MIEVEQRQLWRPADHPDGPQFGDCYRACIASLFEVDYELVPELRGDTHKLHEWLSEVAPGVRVQHRILGDLWKEPETLDSWRQWPATHHEFGYWIATVKSSRIPDLQRFGCGCADDAGVGDPSCKWCHGKPGERSMGIQWGLHAVVMRNRDLAWDPHPLRDGTVGPFRGAETFHLDDPAPAIRALAGFEGGGG